MHRPLKILARSIRDFLRDGGPVYSAALAFFSITSMVPLSIVVITIFGYFMGQQREFQTFLVGKLVAMFPASAGTMASEMTKLITYKGIGKISVALFLLLASQWYSALAKGLSVVFQVQERRSLPVAAILPVAVGGLLLLMLTVSFVLSAGAPIAQLIIKKYAPGYRLGVLIMFSVRYLLPLLMTLAAATIIYKIVPYKRIRIWNALWGGLFTAIMTEAAKYLFNWYVESVADIGKIYGSLSVFIMFLLWLYYLSAIFLIGGAIVNQLEEVCPGTRAKPD